jgi:hypothetical protein
MNPLSVFPWGHGGVLGRAYHQRHGEWSVSGDLRTPPDDAVGQTRGTKAFGPIGAAIGRNLIWIVVVFWALPQGFLREWY